ncbi:DUF3307 domain-containing protein [Streptococcus orisratti]|uniref:DUF3307 domain-containing protein n=1 Tax=Streptococcus orisratti TaxID=114652 RepID=UPI00035EC881|nr:DUF3307 domain-containing protein [Streptococcus orisratti]
MTGLSHILSDNPILTSLLICHFLSDFQLQSQRVADRKSSNLIYLSFHLVGVAVPLLIMIALQPKIWWLALLIWISHACIDYFKPRLTRLLKLTQSASFSLDQMLHLVIIILLGLSAQNYVLPEWLSPTSLNLILFLVLITKPTNIAFKLYFTKYQPKDIGKIDTIPGAGATIGLLERIIIAFCLFFNQFASIGLVFTAKSIARYDKISKDPAFAEYYLIGSLFSILSVLLAAWICLF